MDYDQAMAFLEDTKKYGSRLGLASIRTLMSLLGDVQNKVPAVHIAGTNGKGSVGAMLSAVLTESGYHVGRFSTPDVFSYEEEFMLDGKPIEKERLARLFTAVRKCCKKMIETGCPHPTRFEVETAAAFLFFYEENCDIALIEVGMGGETDATNVIERPLVSVLTPISMDHMGFLGDSLAEIAAVKAGIIKEGCPVVSARQEAAAAEVIARRCREKETFCVWADARENVRDVRAVPGGGIAFSCRLSEDNANKNAVFTADRAGLPGECKQDEAAENEWLRLRISLSGTFQAENALCALETLHLLRENYPRICAETIRRGLENVSWPGRFEKIGSRPDFYLDGAHNEGAAQRLRETLKLYFREEVDLCIRDGQKSRRIFYIMGVLADKEYGRMAEIMFSAGDRVFTVTPHNPRALDGHVLADLLRNGGMDAVYCDTADEAVSRALSEAAPRDVIVAFGSLSYLREVREALTCEQEK